MNVIMMNHNGVTVLKGKQEVIREKVEELINESLGLSLSLQEDTEEGLFQIYLHADSYEELSDDDIQRLEEFRITDNPEIATEGIQRLLNIRFQLEKTSQIA